MTSSSYLSLLQNKLNQNTLSIIDSGIDINSLEHYPKTINDPFNPSSAVHVLETSFDIIKDLSLPSFQRKMQLQYQDVLKDQQDQTWDYLPTGIITHCISYKPRCISTNTIIVAKIKHVCVLTCWQNGETSWVQLASLKEQNPWVVIRYVIKNGLRKHPDFKWVNQYLDKDGNTLIKVL